MRMTPEPHWFEGPLTFTVEDTITNLRSAVRTDAPVLISGWSRQRSGSPGSRDSQPRLPLPPAVHNGRLRGLIVIVVFLFALLVSVLANG